jgi:hypothetical protein
LNFLFVLFRGKSGQINYPVPVMQWHHMIGEKAIADAVPGRIVHNAHRIGMVCESPGKRQLLMN